MRTNAIVLLAPDLGIATAEFERAWLEEPECTDAASLDFNASPEHFDLDAQSAAAIATFTALGVGIAKDLILHLVKKAMERADKRHDREIEVVQMPDTKTGLPLFVVRRRDEQ